jgi:3-deoxy-D-manno-octulosonic-acid transferase
MWLLYQAGTALVLLLAGPFLLARRGSHYLATLPGRLSRYPRRPASAGGGLWIHAVSVGEVAVAATLARGLPEALRPRLVTTVTPTGQQRALAAFGSERVAYLPFELGFAVRRFFSCFQPAALVLVEGDYWPLVLRAARRRGLPVAVVNGRMSERSFRRMRWLQRCLPAALETLLGGVDGFGVQTAGDRDRLLALGVPAARITVTGNLKYDTPEPALAAELAALVEARAAGRPILVAGSTMEGEEEAVAEALERLGTERALLVLAPRHPERWDGVERALRARGLRVARRSAKSPAGEAPDVLLLDTLGELAAVYRLARAAFIGGTLVDTGGHNPLEPAVFGVPVYVGPSMHHFQEMADAFDQAQAWFRVHDAETLAAAWRRALDGDAEAARRGERGRALIADNRGATARTLALLMPLLAPALASSRDDGREEIAR